MLFQTFLGAAAVVVIGARGADNSFFINFKTATAKQAASDLQNVSTFNVLSRQPGVPTLSQFYKNAWRNGKWGGYGLSGTTSVDNANAYSTPIKVGTETFEVVLDTGSSDTWILESGAECYDDAGNLVYAECGFGPEWDQEGCVPIPDENFNINYGGSDITTGTWCKIDTTMGGITAQNQQVAAVNAAEGFVPGVSGLVGMAYTALEYAYTGTNYSADNSSINQAPYSPIFRTMYTQGHIPPVFSVALNRASTQYTEDGYLALGGLAPVATYGDWGVAPIQTVVLSNAAPDPGYIPTVLPGRQYEWYTITPDAFLWQTGTNLVPHPNEWKVFPNPSGNLSWEQQYIFDTGATYLDLPPPIADGIASKFIPPAISNPNIGFGSYSVPCNATAPWFGVQIGGVIFPVDKKDMIVSDQTGEGTCQTGTQNLLNYAPYTLGDTFMNNVLSVFDVGSGEMKIRARVPY